MKCRLLTIAGLFLAPLPAIAAETDPIPRQINFLEVMAAGGMMMYVLVVLSVLCVVLILFCLLTIRRNTIISDRFMNAAEAMIRQRDYLGLIAYCHRQNECIARITFKAIDFFSKHPNAPIAEVRELAQTEGSRQANILSTRIAYLADLGAIAPMVGLLGTVIGMIKAFIEISQGSVQGVRQMQLAAGVSEALIATASGLSVAIPALVFYAFFRARVGKYISELEAGSTHLLALLHAQTERPATYAAGHQASREEYGAPVISSRPDLHGI